MKKIFITILLLLTVDFVCAQNATTVQIIPPYTMQQYDREIIQLYNTLPAARSRDIATRIAAFSQYFLGRKYVLGPLGEGPHAPFDQGPLYRTDVFDCVTYVSTVLALAESNNLEEFKETIKRINYRDGEVSHITRNHFMSVDWNKNNNHNGYIEDITHQFLDSNHQPIAAIADTVITKPRWFNQLPYSALHLLQPVSHEKADQLLQALHTEAKHVKNERSVLHYLPFTALFNPKGKPNHDLFDQIPSGAIIEIVRPAWDLHKEIGTSLHVSHLGFAIRTSKGELLYRQASSNQHQVIDIPLIEYLQKYLKSPTVKGINVQKITFPT